LFPTDTRGLKPIYMEVCYWALLFMPLVILHHLLNAFVQLSNKMGLKNYSGGPYASNGKAHYMKTCGGLQVLSHKILILSPRYRTVISFMLSAALIPRKGPPVPTKWPLDIRPFSIKFRDWFHIWDYVNVGQFWKRMFERCFFRPGFRTLWTKVLYLRLAWASGSYARFRGRKLQCFEISFSPSEKLTTQHNSFHGGFYLARSRYNVCITYPR
jgi:hypothetical protein